MTTDERLRESLSALMDDEANQLELERLLSRISDDEDLRQTWIRYQSARAVVANEPMSHFNMDISRQVQAAVAGGQTQGSADSSSVLAKMLRPLASFAVAASVTVTVVVGGQQLARIDSDQFYGNSQHIAAGPSPVGLVNSLGASSFQASYGTRAMPVLQPATHTAYRELARQRMARYMQEHAEQAALNLPQGLIPFARVPRIKE